MNKGIRVRLPFFGWQVKKSEITKILDIEEKNPYFKTVRERLEHFFGLPFDCLSIEILTRYFEVSRKDLNIPLMPTRDDVLKRILEPLKLAKKSYCFGEYISSIALCGMIGEMLGIMVWKIHEIKVKGKLITEIQEEGLFGKKFEELGQYARLKILKTLECITQPEYSKLVDIRRKRNFYIHHWNIDYHKEKEDARNIYQDTFRLFKKITGIRLNNGRLEMKLLFKKFLQNQI